MTYPDGSDVDYSYGIGGSRDDRINRVIGINADGMGLSNNLVLFHRSAEGRFAGVPTPSRDR